MQMLPSAEDHRSLYSVNHKMAILPTHEISLSQYSEQPDVDSIRTSK